jgi:ankyrin repeat protein
VFGRRPLMSRFVKILALYFLISGVALAQNEVWESRGEEKSVKLLKMVESRHFANIEEIKALVFTGADVNYADENGVTVLMHAAYHGVDAVKLMKLLIEHGADVNAQDNKGQTPIMFAATNYISRFQSLVSVGLQLFFIKRPDVSDLRLLFDSGADLNIRDNEGRTVMDRVRTGVIQPSNKWLC